MKLKPAELRAHAADAASLLKALSHEARLMILCILVEGERSVGELNAELDISQSALSQHLAVLRDGGLVKTRRDGQHIHYSVADKDALRVLKTLHGIYCS